MTSQLDWDQGGTSRQIEKVYMGPSVGWVFTSVRTVFPITAAGTYTLQYGNSLVTINVQTGVVTIILPSAIDPTVVAGALPGPYTKTPITLVDIGGFAFTNNILLQPASVAETIMGLAQIKIQSNYGGYILQPNSSLKTWVNAQ